jgi:hypothetical protein
MPTVSSLNFMKKSKIIQKRLTIPHLASSMVLSFLMNPSGISAFPSSGPRDETRNRRVELLKTKIGDENVDKNW